MGGFRSRVTSAHLIAGVALVFAVGGGSAVALKGTNSVDSGDIRNGAVRSPDVGANALRGVDIREQSLDCDAIPAADCATDATNPAVRGAAANDGEGDVDLISAGGFRFYLDCAGNTEIDVDNVSAGADSLFEVEDAETTGVDEGSSYDVVSVGGDANNIEEVGFSAVATNGVVLHGQATVVDNPTTGFGGADCVGSMTVSRSPIAP
jgi:hypothetical protein